MSVWTITFIAAAASLGFAMGMTALAWRIRKELAVVATIAAWVVGDSDIWERWQQFRLDRRARYLANEREAVARSVHSILILSGMNPRPVEPENSSPVSPWRELKKPVRNLREVSCVP